MDWVPVAEMTPQAGHSYVYVMDCGEMCKIGRSMRPADRIASLRRISGRGVVETWVLPGVYDSIAMESHLHRIFCDHRFEGEWFTVDAKSVLSLPIESADFPQRVRRPTDQEAVSRLMKAMFPEPQFDPIATTAFEVLAALMTHLAVFAEVTSAEPFDLAHFFEEVTDTLDAIGGEDWSEQYEKFSPPVREIMSNIVRRAHGEITEGGAA